jgi:hypothetical protein
MARAWGRSLVAGTDMRVAYSEFGIASRGGHGSPDDGIHGCLARTLGRCLVAETPDRLDLTMRAEFKTANTNLLPVFETK